MSFFDELNPGKVILLIILAIVIALILMFVYEGVEALQNWINSVLVPS